MARIKKTSGILEKMMAKNMKDIEAEKVCEIINLTDTIMTKQKD